MLVSMRPKVASTGQHANMYFKKPANLGATPQQDPLKTCYLQVFFGCLIHLQIYVVTAYGEEPLVLVQSTMKPSSVYSPRPLPVITGPCSLALCAPCR